MNALRKELKESDPEYLNCECPICGKKFHLKPYAKNRYKEHTCSKECNFEHKRILMSGERNHQYGLKGSLNASWKSDEYISSYGYKLIRKLDHPFATKAGFVFEHRLVAEQYLLTDENSIEIDGSLYLKPELHVHHKDKNRLNNDPSNLEVMEASAHCSYHNKLNPIPRDKLGRFCSPELAS